MSLSEVSGKIKKQMTGGAIKTRKVLEGLSEELSDER